MVNSASVPLKDPIEEKDKETGRGRSGDEGEEGGSLKGWLLGAYAVLVVWGAAYLVLFFTGRLPA